MRILTAPARLTLSTASPARMSIILHNDEDEDRVCFPTLEGLGPGLDAIFEPSLGFIEARCAAKFDVFIEASGAGRTARVERALWTLYADGRVVDCHPITINLEAYRALSARITETARPELVLFNEGVVDESVTIDTLIDKHATPAMARQWTLGPGSWVSVPLEFEQANLQPVTLCITGGPRPLLIETRAPQHPRLATADRRVRRQGNWRRAALASGAVAASLLLGMPLDRVTQAPVTHVPVASVAKVDAFAPTAVLAEAMPFVALERSIGAIHVGAADRQIVRRLIAQRIVALAQAPTRIIHARAAHAPLRTVATRRVLAAPLPAHGAPHVTKLDTPAEVAPGSRVAIRYGSTDARSVRIVARIGPTVVRTFDVAGGSGQVSMNAPQGRKTVRLMTVRIYALGSAHATAMREALVSITPG